MYRLRSNKQDNSTSVFGELGQPQSRDAYIVEAYNSNAIENPTINYYESLSRLVMALFNEEVDAIWLDARFGTEIATLFPEFGSKTIVSASYTTDIVRENIAKDVNILEEPYVVYVSGIDVYGSTNTRSRSDLNLLVVINPKTQNVLSVSIPRDTYVPLACRENAMDKLTHAALYGVECSTTTLEAMLGIDINYYVRVNFTSLATVVDALNGVDVYSEYTFDTESGYHFDEGYNEVLGDAAIAFARERMNIPYGDVSRGKNHQALLEAILKKMFDPSVVSRLPTMVPSFMNVIDTNYGYDNFSEFLSQQIDNTKQWNFERVNLTGTGDMQYTYSQGDTYKYYVYWPDSTSISEIQTKIQSLMAQEQD